MTAHSNISKAQSTCLMIQKENLDSDTCIIMIDFAENYQYVLEDEIQSFHWNNNQCSIQPAVIYYKNVLNVLQEKSFGFISEDLKHDTAFVYEVKSKVCECIWGNYLHITKVKHFSDGCAAQYNNYKNSLNLCHHCSHSGLEVDWDFFATNHGKLAIIGIGGPIKPLTATAGLQRPYNNQILSEEIIHQFCSKTIEHISFNSIKRDTLNLLWDK